MNPNDKFFGTDETKDETGDSVENKTAAVSEYRELSKEEIDALSPENEVPWDTMSESSVTSYDQNEVMFYTISYHNVPKVIHEDVGKSN